MKVRKIDYNNVRGKYVLLRDDLNVQIEDGKILDDFRIEQSWPTINALRAGGARVVICAHLGRPKGVRDMSLSMRPIADYMNVPLIDDCLNREFMSDMRDGDVVMLENVRFYIGEEKNDMAFAADLARGFDLYVNDAFAVSHRAHASTVGVAEILPSYAGNLLASEIECLSRVTVNPARPLLAIVAGSKISTKIGVLRALAKLSDKLIIGGAMGTTFNYALDANVGNSLFEADQKENALSILEYARENDCEVLLPLDKGVVSEFVPTATRQNRSADEIRDADIIIDEGIESSRRNVAAIDDAATVIWNGTVGMAEWPDVGAYGSCEIANAIARQTRAGKIVSIVGGGATVAAVRACGVKDDMTYVSTGGGAFLEFIEGRTLPGIAILYDE